MKTIEQLFLPLLILLNINSNLYSSSAAWTSPKNTSNPYYSPLQEEVSDQYDDIQNGIFFRGMHDDNKELFKHILTDSSQDWDRDAIKMTFLPEKKDLSSLEVFIDQIFHSSTFNKQEGRFSYLIFSSHETKKEHLIGWIELHINPNIYSQNFALIIKESHRRKGYGKKSLLSLTKLVGESCDILKISLNCCCRSDNKKMLDFINSFKKEEGYTFRKYRAIVTKVISFQKKEREKLLCCSKIKVRDSRSEKITLSDKKILFFFEDKKILAEHLPEDSDSG